MNSPVHKMVMQHFLQKHMLYRYKNPTCFFSVLVDVTQAGEGQLEIMVNRGSVPNTVKMSRKGVFLVSFLPRDARTHIIDIKFNGELLPRK